jgi:uncharacterized membrane protein YeaQ/YmgE (transglycosylase-associated protein family)
MTLRREWIKRVTVGELVGFTAPALTSAALAGASIGAQVAGLVGAGAVEGAVLGLAQASVLVRVLPTLSRRKWVVATAGAAALAWLLGMLPAATHQFWAEWPVGVVVAVGLPLGLLLLVAIGVAQAWVLPAWRLPWVALTSAAWCAGLAVFTAVTTPLWQPGQATPQALPRLARLQATG